MYPLVTLSRPLVASLSMQCSVEACRTDLAKGPPSGHYHMDRERAYAYAGEPCVEQVCRYVSDVGSIELGLTLRRHYPSLLQILSCQQLFPCPFPSYWRWQQVSKGLRPILSHHSTWSLIPMTIHRMPWVDDKCSKLKLVSHIITLYALLLTL